VSINGLFRAFLLNWNDRIRPAKEPERRLGMKSRLLLTLWLAGAVLYAASTIFLAHAVLGGGSTVPGDKSKAGVVTAAANAQCKKDSVASGEASPTKNAAPEPQKTAAIEPQKPAPAPIAAKPSAPETAKRDSAELHPTTGAGLRSADNDSPSDDSQDRNASSPDDAPPPDGFQQQEATGPGAGEEPAEQEEWARVVAGTADMRSEPSMQAQLIYALPAGWQVRVISRQPGWAQVQDANSGAAGWVEATALAPSGGPGDPGGPGGRPGYDAYGRPYGDPYNRYADEGYPYDPPWQARRRAEFGDFLRRALGGW
jgi:Bacterial SH3 domain